MSFLRRFPNWFLLSILACAVLTWAVLRFTTTHSTDLSTQAEMALQRFLPIMLAPELCANGKSPTYAMNGVWTCAGATLATDSTPQMAATGIGGAAGAANTIKLYGSSSGSLLFAVPAAAGASTLTFPVGTTDFTGTGGASQVLRQSSLGGALTVSQLTTADISGLSAQPLSATTASIGGSILIAGACATGTVSVANSTTGMVAVASPNTYPGDGVVWDAQVTTNGTVTVKVCAIIGLTPSASTYNVRVLP